MLNTLLWIKVLKLLKVLRFEVQKTTQLFKKVAPNQKVYTKVKNEEPTYYAASNVGSDVGIKKIVRDGVTFYFIDNEQYFNRGTVYGEWDDGERFGFFQMAALELMEKVDFIPDILHAHDYHTGMIPFLDHWIQACKVLRQSSLSTILKLQGQFDSGMLWEIFGVGYERYADGTLRWNDCLNWMKAAVLYADRVTTVSRSYAGDVGRCT